MPLTSLIQLVLLAALWGASFLFLRIGVPAFGVGWLIELRVLFAFVFLLAVGALLKQPIRWRTHWQHYARLGLFSAALPFLLFAYAAKVLPASLLSVFNSTAPIWGALLGLVFQKQHIRLSAMVGMGLGVLGVAILTLGDMHRLPADSGLALLAATLAPLSYAIGAGVAQRAQASVGAFANAAGSMGMSSLLILPLCWPSFSGNPTTMAWGAALMLGIACTGAAYLIYFKLTDDVGPVKALSATFLIPVFGMLWGALFLSEPITNPLLIGGAMIILGTVLSTGVRVASLVPKSQKQTLEGMSSRP